MLVGEAQLRRNNIVELTSFVSPNTQLVHNNIFFNKAFIYITFLAFLIATV